MKRTNKYLSLALAIIMALSLCVTSFAASITVTNAQKGETYDAYKIFDVTNSGSNYSYSILDTDAWFNVVVKFMTGADAVADQAVFTGKGLTLTKTATNADMYVLTVDNTVFNTAKAAEFAAFLADNIAKEEDGTATATADGSLTINVDKAGYYFVDTTLGALCALLTNEENVNLVEKNVEPTITKTVDKSNTFIGDTVTFTLTVKDGKGTDSPITIHDEMEAGLTLNPDSFKVGNVALTTAITGAEIKTTGLEDDCTFEIILPATYVNTLAENAEVVITYTATLNANAEIFNATNDNTAWLTYSAQTSAEQKVTVETYEINVFKHDKDDKGLANAEFVLKKTVVEDEEEVTYYATASEATVEGKLVYTITGWAAEGKTFVSPTNGEFKIKGLEAGTFALEEKKAPDGYNLIAEDKVITLDNTNSNQTIKVLNTSGAILPSTGGVGTTMFYVLGSVMMIGAAILLVTKKKMANEQ